MERWKLTDSGHSAVQKPSFHEGCQEPIAVTFCWRPDVCRLDESALELLIGLDVPMLFLFFF